jgi:hypothetical protein
MVGAANLQHLPSGYDALADGTFGRSPRRRNLVRPLTSYELPSAQPPPLTPVLAYATSLG